MNEQEKELQYKTSIILGKDTTNMTINEIIAGLVNVVESVVKNNEQEC
ncbi:hypothetical protein ACIQAA_05325 [Neobacillus sp. NPDC093182]